MPLDLGDDEARAYLRTADGPGPLLDLVGMMAAHAAAAALELGVFDALAASPAAAADLARDLPADPTALPVLLDTLAATGYLAVDGDQYTVTPLTRQWLCPPSEYGRVFRLWVNFVTQMWGGLAGAVRTGRPGADFYAWLGERPELAGQFQQLQAGLAGWLAEEVVALAPVPAGARVLLDLGGGHGAFSAAFCERHPALAATVVDLPAAVPTAPPEGRVRWRAGDLTAGVPDRDQDVVLLCNVVHGFPEEQARKLVSDAVAALRPGGLLVLVETEARAGAGVADQAFTRCFALHVWHTQGGLIYPAETLAGWLRSAGCQPPQRHELTRSPSHVLLTATR